MQAEAETKDDSPAGKRKSPEKAEEAVVEEAAAKKQKTPPKDPTHSGEEKKEEEEAEEAVAEEAAAKKQTGTTPAPSVDYDAMQAILNKPDPTDKEKAQKALNDVEEALCELSEHGIDGAALVKVFKEDGVEALQKVLDGLHEQNTRGLQRKMAFAKVAVALLGYSAPP